MITIAVVYSCAACCCFDVSVDVRARVIGEELGPWFATLAETISEDHRLRSPRCTSERMDYVRVPLYGPKQGLGFPTLN